jgi:plasmid maintenance system antidote protein VapI
MMESFQISITPTRRAATRFIAKVRRSLLKALVEENELSGLTQTDVANTIGVHRSVVNRELRGMKDMTLGRVAELAFSIGREIEFELVKPELEKGRNSPKEFKGPISGNSSPLVIKQAGQAGIAMTSSAILVAA